MNVLHLLALICVVLVVPGGCSTLYGYFNSTDTRGLVVINPQTGDSSTICDLSSLPVLFGASSSSFTTGGTLLFYTINSNGNISLVEVDPKACKATTILITGLDNGQDDVRDIKYDQVNNMLYMVFPNPFCMHGSLDQINTKTGAVISHLTNVIDPVGLSQTAGLDGKDAAYYYVGIPIGANSIEYQLNKVNLVTGNATAINLVNNNLDVGDTWGANYTLNVLDTVNGGVVIGAVSPSNNTAKGCFPSGFYEIDTTTGEVSCTNGPIPYLVYPLAELDPTTMYYYQLFTDSKYNFYLTTYDTHAQKVLSTTPCKICSELSVLAALP